MTGRPTLTDRQLEILALIALGQTTNQAAKALGVRVQTIGTTLARLRVRLGVQTNREAVARVREMGLIR